MDVISTHTNADFDTLSSMVAASRLYPGARLVFPGSMEKGLRDAMETIKTMDRPCAVSRLKEIDMAEVTRLILVDIRHPSRIGPFSEIVGREDVEVHLYDHHRRSKDDITGTVDVYEKYGSTTTILVHILKKKSIDPTPAEATVMMAGIYEDTGYLTYATTTVKDFEAASFLLERGADLPAVAELLKKEITRSEVEALSELLKSETVYTIGGVEVTIAEARGGMYKGDVATLAHRLREIESIKCLFLLAEMGDRIQVVARSSIKRLDAGKVAKKLGGGGHHQAASATIKGATIIEAKEQVIAALKETVVPERTARDVMSSPAIVVDRVTPIKEALELMRRYNINALPVEDGGIGAGVITRQVASKAFYHGLAAEATGDYMTTEVKWVTPDTSVDEIREMVIALGQRILPVITGTSTNGGAVAGVITRTDILKLLQDELQVRPASGKKRKSLKSLMHERLPRWVLKVLTDAGETAEELGCGAYVVGGFVRDLLMRRENFDIDLVIERGGEGGGEADGVRFAEVFAKRHGLRVRTHKRFKTAVLIYPDGFKVDVATARLEYYQRPGALPTVELSSLKLDLFRRDFTINTLAMVIRPEKFGTLIDYFGGQRDIKEKTIRVLHNLSFVEDPTRALRAVRFRERFGFKMGPHTLNLIKKTVKAEKLTKLPGSRLREELVNILKEDHVTATISSLSELGLLPLIHPSLKWTGESERLFEAAREAVAWHRLLYSGEKTEEWLTLFLALTDPLSGEELAAMTKRLAVSGKGRLRVLSQRTEAIRALGLIKSGEAERGSHLYSLLDPLPLETTLYLMAKARGETTREAISTYITKLRSLKTILKGKDLLQMGIDEGPRIGETLEMIFKMKLDGVVATKEDEIEAAGKMAASHR